MIDIALNTEFALDGGARVMGADRIIRWSLPEL
jgi:hypothetical protein